MLNGEVCVVPEPGQYVFQAGGCCCQQRLSRPLCSYVERQKHLKTSDLVYTCIGAALHRVNMNCRLPTLARATCRRWFSLFKLWFTWLFVKTYIDVPWHLNSEQRRRCERRGFFPGFFASFVCGVLCLKKSLEL